MSRINNNVGSMIAQRVLGQQNHGLTKSLERLSTGLRINRGGDDPAGLIASERLRSEKTSIEAAIGNAERADQVMNIAEGGLQEINSLLMEVQSLVGQSANDAGLSQDEKEANQQQIDSILQTIDRIAGTTSFQGVKLLNGGFDYQASGVDGTNVNSYSINAAKLETGDTRDVQVLVTQSAQHAAAFLSTGGNLDLTDASSTFKFEVAGKEGAREFSFASGTSLDDISTSINTFTSVTGVSAAVSGGGLVLKSTEYGENEFVSLKIVDAGGQTGNVYNMEDDDENAAQSSGTSIATGVTLRDEGQDVGGFINGVTAVGKGRELSVATDFLDVKLELGDGAIDGTTTSFTAMTIDGGGAKFNLGANVNINNQVAIGIKNVSTRNLGRTVDGSDTFSLADLTSGKDLNVVNGDLENAQKAINGAITEVSQLRGRLGAFQKNVVGATIRSLGVALENTSAAESAVRDTDFAKETAEMTRSQILVQAATSALQVANSRPSAVLGLIG